jgi:hypothetical protein
LQRLRLEHDAEKWIPVSRLREALSTARPSFDASAGEGRSEKIMLKEQAAASKETLMTSAMTRAELTEKLLGIKRENGWSWKHICAEIGGMSPVLITDGAGIL